MRPVAYLCWFAALFELTVTIGAAVGAWGHFSLALLLEVLLFVPLLTVLGFVWWSE